MLLDYQVAEHMRAIILRSTRRPLNAPLRDHRLPLRNYRAAMCDVLSSRLKANKGLTSGFSGCIPAEFKAREPLASPSSARTQAD